MFLLVGCGVTEHDKLVLIEQMILSQCTVKSKYSNHTNPVCAKACAMESAVLFQYNGDM